MLKVILVITISCLFCPPLPRQEVFRQKLLNDSPSIEKLHKMGIQVSYLCGLKWQVYPNEVKEIILISSSHQRVIKFVDGLPKFVYICSTRARGCGKERFGYFAVKSKERRHFSRKYRVAMPFALQIDGAIFIHETRIIRQLGRRASHGCIRLNRANAKELYESTKVGTPVVYLP